MDRIKCFLVEHTDQTAVHEYEWKGEKHQNQLTLWRNVETGELKFLSEHGVGAMWFADWLDDVCEPQLDHVLVVRTPGGDWVIDAQANNCTNPTKTYVGDDGKTYQPKMQTDHHCWVIHGTAPEITVDKAGTTCGAGAGSIQQGSYHGLLRCGYLEEC